MIEDDLTYKEPKNFVKWLLRFWSIVGIWILYDDITNEEEGIWKQLTQMRNGVDYQQKSNLWFKYILPTMYYKHSD